MHFSAREVYAINHYLNLNISNTNLHQKWQLTLEKWNTIRLMFIIVFITEGKMV